MRNRRVVDLEDRGRLDAERAHFDRLYPAEPWQIHQWMREDPRFRLLGPVAGRRILDFGCGKGEWAVLLAERGAQVVALDLSLQGLRRARSGAEAHGQAIRCVVGDGHRLPFPDQSFDLIHGQFILHHLDVHQAGSELARVLKAGGRAVFLETSANNPVLMLARRVIPGRLGIPRLSTDSEYPLRHADVCRLAAILGHGGAHYFEFECFSIADRNLFGGYQVLGWLDPLIFRFLPPLRRYGYTQWLCFQRPDGSPGAARQR